MKMQVESKYVLVSKRRLPEKNGNKLVLLELGISEQFEKVTLIGDGEIQGLDDLKKGDEVIADITFTSVEIAEKTYFRAFVSGLRLSR